jgi:hypothetical protein
MFTIERGYQPLRQPRLSTRREGELPRLPLLTPAPASTAVCQPKGLGQRQALKGAYVSKAEAKVFFLDGRHG